MEKKKSEFNCKSISKVIQRSSWIRNSLWLTNLLGRSPDRSVMHCFGQRSFRGQLGSTWGQIAYKFSVATKFGRKNPQRVMHCWGPKSCKGQLGSIWGRILRNALWLPNLIEGTSHQNVMHCCCQRSCRGQLGSIRGQIA